MKDLIRLWFICFASYLTPVKRNDRNDFLETFEHDLNKKVASLNAFLDSKVNSCELEDSDFIWVRAILSDSIPLIRKTLPAVVRLSGKFWSPLRFALLASQLSSIDLKRKSSPSQFFKKLRKIVELHDLLKKVARDSIGRPLSDILYKAMEEIRSEKLGALVRHNITLEAIDFDLGRDFLVPAKDALKYQQLLANILRNSLEAIEHRLESNDNKGFDRDYKGKIAVALRNLSDSDIEIRILDNGCGMDSETLAKFTKRGFSTRSPERGEGINDEKISSLPGLLAFETSSQISKGTEIKLRITTQGQYPDYRKRLIVRWSAATIILLLLSGLAFSWLVQHNSAINFNLEHVNGYTLRTIDSNGKVIAVKSFSHMASDLYAWGGKQSGILEGPGYFTADLDRDGRNEAVVFFRHKTETLDFVACYDERFREKWAYYPGMNNPYLDLPTERFGLMYWYLDTLSSDKETSLILTSLGHYYPAEIAVLTSKGGLKCKYWHSGHLKLYLVDFDQDGNSEIIVHGVNNGVDWRAFLAVLDPDSMPIESQSPTTKPTNPEVPNGRELYYVLLPHLTNNSQINWEDCFEMCEPVKVNPEYVIANISYIRQYEFTNRFKLQNIKFYPHEFLRNMKLQACRIEITNYDSSSYWYDGIEIYHMGKRIK